MDKISVILIGANGRLGSLIQKLEKTTAKLEFTALIGKRNTAEFENAVSRSNVVLDVSSPESTLNYLKRISVLGKNIPYVIGCTGWNEAQLNAVREYSKAATVVLAPNFSPLIAMMCQITESIAPKLKKLGYSTVIKETHHEKKADSPSGTAKLLAEIIIKSGSHPNIDSFREGQVVGKHELHFTGSYDHLTVAHEATDRIVFAQGAILAARWAAVNSKNPDSMRRTGMFSMNDVLADSH